MISATAAPQVDPMLLSSRRQRFRYFSGFPSERADDFVT
jgi:hypothetical protein